MNNSLIPYHEIVPEILRGVLPKVLLPVAEAGMLPGEHHFYVSFATTAEGVQIPGYLKAQYPDVMTIVLQHQFTGLYVNEEGFGVTLSFGGTPAKLFIPFAAVTLFRDPAVNFVLPFEAPGARAKAAPEKSDAVEETEAGADTSAESETADGETTEESDEAAAEEPDNVVTVDFRRKK